MQSDSSMSVPSSVSSSSDGSSSYNRKDVDPYILADLKYCEHCDCTAGSQNSFSSSKAMEKLSSNSPGGTPGPSSPDSTPEYTTVSRELLDECVKKVILVSTDAQLQEYIQEYQKGYKEKLRYQPFVKLANHALKLLKSLEAPESRAQSDLEILFHVNDDKRIAGMGGSARKTSNEDWEEWADVLVFTELKWEFATLGFE
ncbi:hypothetical protein B0J17DRAFT_634351 [Rhizoctonia solani]|nr:hypothetical protein B0J17DRAFT_634351 [Rhizoctonia solani]